MDKKGFTLAEVLITLAIIGVVAALTIPTVVQNYQKHQTVVRLKKAYSVLSQAINLGVAENGTVVTDDGEEFTDKYLIPYLKIQKRCGNTSGECEFKYSTLNGYGPYTEEDSTRFILTDGTLILASQMVTICGMNGSNMEFCYNPNIMIDINGSQKAPNALGKDIFSFNYFPKAFSYKGTSTVLVPKASVGKLISGGTSSDSYDPCVKGVSSMGYACAGKIMKDGWQIKDDYPWN